METNQIQIQVIGNNPKSFPANNFSILQNGDDIICNFIYDDMSQDPATCISVSITQDSLRVFLESSKEVIKRIGEKKSKFISWDNRKPIGREISPFRVSVINPLMINDIVHLSLGYIHPANIRKDTTEIQAIQIPSLVEISYAATHFLKLYEKLKEILSAIGD